jgi:hypothetical protein
MATVVEKPKEKVVRKEIEEFRKKYTEALADAQVSASHTAQTGWQNLYGMHRLNVQKERKSLASQLRQHADTLERGTLSEEGEKWIGEVKKDSAALRGMVNAFESQTVEPVRQPVYRCESVIEDARRAAREAEGQAPLQARGLIAEMDEAINSVPKVRFDEETGVVEIKPGDGELGTAGMG